MIYFQHLFYYYLFIHNSQKFYLKVFRQTEAKNTLYRINVEHKEIRFNNINGRIKYRILSHDFMEIEMTLLFTFLALFRATHFYQSELRSF